jgi:hypothetical protein
LLGTPIVRSREPALGVCVSNRSSRRQPGSGTQPSKISHEF